MSRYTIALGKELIEPCAALKIDTVKERPHPVNSIFTLPFQYGVVNRNGRMYTEDTKISFGNVSNNPIGFSMGASHWTQQD